MKSFLFIAFIGLSNICLSQKNFDIARIQEYNFYRQDRNDSFRIEYYKSGAIKYEQNEEYEIRYNYIDSTKDDSLYSSILTVSRFSFDNCKDSTKKIYKYKEGRLSEIDTYEKKCYREDGGCSKYDNTYAGRWHLILRVSQNSKFNEHRDCVEQIFILEHNRHIDTTTLKSDYTYDAQGRKTHETTYENGKLQIKIIYRYLDDIKRVESYYSDDSLARITTDYKYINGQLVEKFTKWKFDNTTETEKYEYIKPNRLYSIEYFANETNLYKVRKYYYE